MLKTLHLTLLLPALFLSQLGYPAMVRPSYVLGGRAMEIVYSDADIHRYVNTAVEVDPERPVLVDKYLDRADELDVDALAGGCAGGDGWMAGWLNAGCRGLAWLVGC